MTSKEEMARENIIGQKHIFSFWWYWLLNPGPPKFKTSILPPYYFPTTANSLMIHV